MMQSCNNNLHQMFSPTNNKLHSNSYVHRIKINLITDLSEHTITTSFIPSSVKSAITAFNTGGQGILNSAAVVPSTEFNTVPFSHPMSNTCVYRIKKI